MRGFLYLLLLISPLTTGCTLVQAFSGNASKSAKASKTTAQSGNAGPGEPDELENVPSDERGVDRIADLVRRFNHALDAKKFDAATRLLGRAQGAIQHASDVTRANPDFDDLAHTVDQDRDRLDDAIEQDRIARRNAAIDDLIHKGRRAMAQGQNLYAQLVGHVPNNEDLQLLDEVIKDLTDLELAGKKYLNEPRYAAHAQRRNAQTAALRKLRDQARWQRKASDSIGRPVATGYSAAMDARRSHDIQTQITDYQRATAAFRSCVNRIAALQDDIQYAPTLLVETQLGTASVEDTRKRCLTLAEQASSGVDELKWKGSVQQVVAKVNEALAVARTTGSAAAQLKANHKAAGVLAACAKVLGGTETMAGYQAGYVFDTVLGKLTATALRQRCSEEHDRTVRLLPGLEWRTTLADLEERLQQIKSSEDAAGKATDPAQRVTLWKTVVGGFDECVDRAKRSARAPGSDHNLQLDTAFGKLTISAIQRTCADHRRKANDALAAAIKAKELADFVATCHGDERDVAQREGIPSRITNFNGGRVFYYVNQVHGRPQVLRFGFNGSGKRVDFWVTWRNNVVQVASELARVMSAIHDAPDAASAIKAVHAAEPVLEVCQEVLKTGKQNPGYNPTAVFQTPLGKLNVPHLIPACAREKKKLISSVVGLHWRMHLESVRDKLNQSAAEVDQASKTASPDTRLQLLSTALGGLQECLDRTKRLPSRPGANKKLEVATSQGKLNLAGIAKACKRLRKTAKAAADKAVADKRLENFIRSCHGDEVSVAQREGVPTQIEKFDGGQVTGRVFVYVQPRHGRHRPKAKRFAFDAHGNRIDEALLAPVKGQPPVVVHPTKEGSLPMPKLAAPHKHRR